MNEKPTILDCPVCNTKVNFGTKFCWVCGWMFVYFVTEIPDTYKAEYAERLELAKRNWGCIVAGAVASAKTNITIKTGDYIQFGRYYGQPILWRIIHINQHGDPLLFSEYILTYKPFDAAGSGKFGEGDSDREKYGSNNWKNSSLRKWLNSATEKVNYQSLTPPVKEAVRKGFNAYDSESGFLHNFTKEELGAVKSMEHRVMIDKEDQESKHGGNQEYDLCRFSVMGIQDVPENFEAGLGYYMMVADQVFLLSPWEIKEYIYDTEKDSRPVPTPEASSYDEFGQEEYRNYYWTGCPAGPQPSYVWRAGKKTDDEELNFQATNSAVGIGGGVRPALFLNLAAVNFESGGLGTKENPYVVIPL